MTNQIKKLKFRLSNAKKYGYCSEGGTACVVQGLTHYQTTKF